MDISKAIAIEKGSSIKDLEWLAEAAEGKKKIIELGCFHGRSTRAILDNSNAHIWCIDHWRGSRPGAGHGLRASDDDFAVFLENIGDARDRITILKMSTREAAGLLPEGCFDMVFIDADHRYDAVRFDITYYARLLQKGGLLCGHDRSWPGVKQAVAELVTYCREAGAEMWWTVKEPGWMVKTERESLDALYYTIMGPE